MAGMKNKRGQVQQRSARYLSYRSTHWFGQLCVTRVDGLGGWVGLTGADAQGGFR
jgi:hypothetical protein